MKLLQRLFISLINLKFSQVIHRLKKIFYRNKSSSTFNENIKPIFPHSWVVQHLYSDSFAENLEFSALNESKELNLPYDWSNSTNSTLWKYNLNYFNFLDTSQNEIQKERNYYLISNWVDNVSDKNSIPWDPFPLSLRIINYFKFWFAGNNLNFDIFKSLYEQASYLENNLELDLLANHYFSNLKALLFSGLVFKNDKWIYFSNDELIKQLDEQFLRDGSHFERSPMYHNLVIIDLLDIYNAVKSYDESNLNELKHKLEVIIPKALYFMNNMSFENNELPFFNDSSNNIAPDIELINIYAKKLDLKLLEFDKKEKRLVNFADSGYFCISIPDIYLIFSAGNIMPHYNPGHSHANSLSFELSVMGQRVFVNSGISTYEENNVRLYERGTKSSNTVEINNTNSSDVWKSFRVGKRAEIIKSFSKEENGGFEVSAEHNGYKYLCGGCTHERRILLDENSIKISEKFNGNFAKAISRLHVHPNLQVILNKNLLQIIGDKFTLEAKVDSELIDIKESNWNKSFGISEQNICIEHRITEQESSIEFAIISGQN